MSVVEDDIRRVCEEKLPWRDLDNRSVFITGSTGLIMTCMIKVLVELKRRGTNITIYALARSEEKVKQRFYNILPYINFIYADLCELDSFSERIDYIIHAASFAIPSLFSTYPVETVRVNTIGTDKLLQYAVRNQIKSFIYVSSCDVYGKRTIYKKMKEEEFGECDFNNLKFCYCEAKRMGEVLCNSYYKEYGVPIRIVRPVYVYSPEVNDKENTAFTDFFNNIINGENIVLKSKGDSIRSFVYVSDCVSAILRVMMMGENGVAYNISNNVDEITIRELADIFASESDDVEVICNNEVINDDLGKDAIVVDTSKIIELGWIPRIDIRTGIKRSLIGWREITNSL